MLALAKLRHEFEHFFTDGEELTSKMCNTRGGKRNIGTKRFGSGERLMEHSERSLERGDREPGFAAIPAAREAAERAGEFCTQRHGVGNEFTEAVVVLFRVSGGAQFVEQCIECVRGALFDRQTSQMGSFVYASRCKARGDRISAMISLETIGYFSDAPHSQTYPSPGLGVFYPTVGNFIGFVGNVHSRALLRRSLALFRQQAKLPSQGAALPSFIPGIAWSDQWSFWRHGYPAIMITDTAPFRYPHYHSVTDTPDKLDYDRFALVVSGTQKVIEDLVGH